MPLTELIYLIEQSMAQYLASSTYATQTYTLNQLLNELNTNGVSIEFQNILFDTFPGLKWAQPIIQFTGALTRAAWLTIIHNVQEDVYEVEEVATYAEVPASAVAGGVGAAFGLSFTDAAEESWEQIYRRLQIEADTPLPAAIVNEGTEEEPAYKVFLQKEMIEKIRQAMVAQGMFATGDISTNIPVVTGNYSVQATPDFTIDYLNKFFAPVQEYMPALTGSALSFLVEQIMSTVRAHPQINDFFISLGYSTSPTTSISAHISYVGKPKPYTVDIKSVSTGRAFTINNGSLSSLVGTVYADTFACYQTLIMRGSTMQVLQSGTGLIIPDTGTAVHPVFIIGSTPGSSRYFTSTIGTTIAEPIPGIIRQQGATIPEATMEELDYDVLYPGWESVEVGQLEEDGTIVKYPIYPVSVELEDGLIIDVPQAIAQTGAIDIPDVKEWAESIAKPLVTEKVDYFTRTIAKAIPLAVSIPAGDTPPILIPTDSGSAGLFTVYNPSAANLNDIGSFLWQSSIIDQILQLFGNAYDAVISLHEIYVTPSTSGSSIINFGNIPAASVGAVPLVSSRYVTFTYPAMQVPGLNGNALDYQPYVGISIYLPFIGIQELNANDVMDGTISVTYVVDVVTGCCIAHLQITKYDSSQLLYSFEGNCAMQLPVTGREHVLKNELSNIGSLITLGATLYAGSGALNAISAGAGFALSAQGQNVQHKSSMSGNAGALSPRKPYLIINHKLPAMAEGYYEVIGGEANERALLSTCEGYTRVLDVHLEGINCTTSERDEIESLLKAGCIL